MTQEKRRQWWKRLLILLSGPAIIVVLVLTVFAVFQRGGDEQTAKGWDDEVSDAFTYYLSEYIIPVNSTRAGEPSCNEKNHPADVIESCERFVQTLKGREDELTKVADRFEFLASSSPNDMPDEWKQSLYDTSLILRSMRDANMLLVAGWTERDEDQWDLGWQRKEEADEDFRTLSRRLNAEDTP